jgi:purine-binding chemotaxis protein CheW
VARKPAEDIGQLLTFRVADTRFALPATAVREVVRRPSVTRVPHAPASLLGLANLRGNVLPLVSLGALIDKPLTEAGRVIVIEQANPVGILVDEVSAMIERRSDDAAQAQLIDLSALLMQAFGVGRATDRAAHVGSVAAAGRAEPTSDVVLLGFAVSGQEYALPLEQIEEVTRLPAAITLLPKADAAVVGTIARHGRLLPLLSLQVLLGLEAAATDRPRIVIVRIGANRVGLVVDAVSSILRVDESLIDPVPAILSRGAGEARIQAICRLDGGRRLVSVLAAEHLVRDDMTSQLVHKANGEGDDMANHADSADTEQFLVFRLGEQAFGLPIAAVSEVTMLPDKLTRLPKAPAFIDGVMNLRGQVVPVIDQRRRFLGDAAAGKRRRVVVVSLDGVLAGFVVDIVSEVLRVPVSALRAAPELGSDGARVFDRVASLDGGGMILIVEPRELLDRAERDMLVAMAGKDTPTP